MYGHYISELLIPTWPLMIANFSFAFRRALKSLSCPLAGLAASMASPTYVSLFLPLAASGLTTQHDPQSSSKKPPPPPTNCPSCRCDFNRDPVCPSGFDACVCPGPWGDGWEEPKIHQSPDCLHLHGWHDMAGALTHKGVHHAFQGCPASGGWSHSSSVDLVHWHDRGRGVHVINET